MNLVPTPQGRNWPGRGSECPNSLAEYQPFARGERRLNYRNWIAGSTGRLWPGAEVHVATVNGRNLLDTNRSGLCLSNVQFRDSPEDRGLVPHKWGFCVSKSCLIC